MAFERIRTACTALALITATPAAAFEIYTWIDEDGVVHYSDSRPDASGEPVETLYIPARNPPGYDPGDDYWSVVHQAGRIEAERKALEARREEEAALARARAAEERLAALEARVAAAEQAAYEDRPVYAPFWLARGHHRLFPHDVGRPFPHHRPPPHRDRDVGPRPGWPAPDATPGAAVPGFSAPAGR